MPGRLALRAQRFVAAHRGNLLVRQLARWSGRYLSWYGNLDYDLEHNGELRILQAVAARRPRVIFDVGANEGDWSLRALEAAPEAQVHAFELVPDTAERLKARLADRAHVVASGLGEADAEVEVAYAAGASQLASVHDLPHGIETKMRRCRVQRGDDYCRDTGVEHIDFLKIDVEGHELPVLRGFERMLSSGAVDVVQFEYGLAAIYTHDLLRDVVAYLESHGFVTGKVFPGHVEFRPWQPFDEDFMGPNYLAVRADDPELRRALSGAG